VEDIPEIMSEPPVADNHGFSVAAYTDAADTPQRSRRDQSNRLPKLEQAIAPGSRAGFGIVSSKDDGGLVAHRGVLQGEEYVTENGVDDAYVEQGDGEPGDDPDVGLADAAGSGADEPINPS
jgi:hypothetical protein